MVVDKAGRSDPTTATSRRSHPPRRPRHRRRERRADPGRPPRRDGEAKGESCPRRFRQSPGRRPTGSGTSPRLSWPERTAPLSLDLRDLQRTSWSDDQRVRRGLGPHRVDGLAGRDAEASPLPGGVPPQPFVAPKLLTLEIDERAGLRPRARGGRGRHGSRHRRENTPPGSRPGRLPQGLPPPQPHAPPPSSHARAETRPAPATRARRSRACSSDPSWDRRPERPADGRPARRRARSAPSTRWLRRSCGRTRSAHRTGRHRYSGRRGLVSFPAA